MWTGDDLQRLVSRELSDYRLLVVSNRQPYVFNIDESGNLHGEMPPGGLTAAIDPLMRACGGTWIAQSSSDADRAAMDQHGRIPVPQDSPAYRMRLLSLTEEENNGYYYGFSNEGLWPLCHIAYTEPLFDSEHYGFYQSVNRRFADLVLDEIDDDPAIVLIQDYHLALLPRYIREVNQDAIIGQFWHIPWPNPDILRICPWQEEILDGMLGNDLLGFHLSGDCQNFINCVDANLDAQVDPDYGLVDYRNETTLIRPFPISIDFDGIDTEARTPEVEAEMFRLSRELGLNRGRILGLGIDRQDYTKGIPHRLRAVERLLEKWPQYRGRLVFLQAGATSRTNIDSYMQLTIDIESIVNRINQRFGYDGWQPILYWPTSLPSATFSALRRLASFCAESSLHDGMNLVAKEYVASRVDEDGVLILSAFAGAAQELTGSLIINPYATEQFADAIHQALNMSDLERRMRMRQMRNTVQENNIYKWAGRIMMHLMQASTPDHSRLAATIASTA
ncbi:MAG: trehalose-6-phosphate synthase [Chloroflexota bacterium]|nr:trehalose-6-phosphate synthase [Chloroflexota bacterium]